MTSLANDIDKYLPPTVDTSKILAPEPSTNQPHAGAELAEHARSIYKLARDELEGRVDCYKFDIKSKRHCLRRCV